MAAPVINTGRLREPAPDVFHGDRTKTELFKRQFRMYRGLNTNHEIMLSPYLRTMMALTLIKGPLVDDWAADQVTELEDKVTRQINPIAQNDEVLWNDFMTAFDANYSDITKKQGALAALYQLRMQKDRFDDYVATFKHYAKQAGFDLSHAPTIQLFAMGIENKLQDAILHRDNQPDTIDEYITAAHAEIKKYQNRQSIKFPGHAKYQWTGGMQPSLPRTYQQHYAPRNGGQQRPTHDKPIRDPVVFMDVDGPEFTQVRRAYTEAQKQDHKARGACFRCGKQGHMARECPERKEQPFKPSFQPNRFAGQPRPFSPKSPFKSFKPTFQKKPFGKPGGARRPQGFRKFNKPQAYQYVQRARAATIEEMEEIPEEDEYQEYEQGYEPEDLTELAARTNRLSEDERGALLEEMIKDNPDF